MMKTLRGVKLYLVEKYCCRGHVGHVTSCGKYFPQGMTLEGKLLSLFLLLLVIQNTHMHVCVCVFVYVCVCVCVYIPMSPSSHSLFLLELVSGVEIPLPFSHKDLRFSAHSNLV